MIINYENKVISEIEGMPIAISNMLARNDVTDSYGLYYYLVDHDGSLRDIKNLGRTRTITLKQLCPEPFECYKEYERNQKPIPAEEKKPKDPYIYEDLCMAFIRRDDLQIQLKACEENIRYLMQKLTFM